jgi:hypothetical protein
MSSVLQTEAANHHTHPSQPPRYQIPTHLEVPDTIELPLFGLNISLTLRQAVVFFFGWSLAFACWRHTTPWQADGLPGWLLHWGLPGLLALLTIMIAMLQLRGRSLETWGLIMLRYSAIPRLCVWQSVASEHLRQLATMQQEEHEVAEQEIEEEDPFFTETGD